MTWRLYDTQNGDWYNDNLYDTEQDCLAAADHYMEMARSEGETLELVAEFLQPSEALESQTEGEEDE